MRFYGMNRAIITVFLAALVIILISSHDTFASRQHHVTMTPPREIEHTTGTFRADSIRPGQRLSLTFWSSDDAASRIENIQQSMLAQNDSNLTHIGVNLDDSPEIFKHYMIRDNLSDTPNQYLVTDEVADALSAAYGYGTLYY